MCRLRSSEPSGDVPPHDSCEAAKYHRHVSGKPPATARQPARTRFSHPTVTDTPSLTRNRHIATAGRKLAQIEARREAGLPIGSTTGALTEERQDALEAIDPSWCPAWPVAWQRCYKLCRGLIENGTPLPGPGETTVQGEDLGAWVQAQRLDWDQLLPAQQWMLENMLHLAPADPDERPPAPRTQADKWAANIRAARQFHAREGHLQPPRKAVETVDGIEHKIGLFVDNARRRANKLSAERRAELDALGMRW